MESPQALNGGAPPRADPASNASASNLDAGAAITARGRDDRMPDMIFWPDSQVATSAAAASTPSVVPVLLAGGSGTRLWPLSRRQHPKQFLRLLGEHSLLQDTALRARAMDRALPPIALCSDPHRFLVAEQLEEVGITDSVIILEPEGRNTAPAAAVAAHYVAERYGPQTLMMLMPADQVIADSDAFARAVRLASVAATAGRIVTFGIQPTRPDTGFGYLRRGLALATGAWTVDAFVEKPDGVRAQAFLDTGEHFWNGGMFLFQAGVFLDELERFEPETFSAAAEALLRSHRDLGFVRLDAQAFGLTRARSIDYAVMEKTDKAAMVPLDAGWDDVGSWRFLDHLPRDAQGNVVRGDVLLEAASGNLVHAQSRLVALVGVDDHIVIETQDAVLVTTRDRVQDVTHIVSRLVAGKRSEASEHPRMHRPWGSYERIGDGARFQVKRIIVKPGRKLSLQMHHHRAEHWVVVSGTARVSCGDKVFLLHENQSTYIPPGEKHRLENPGLIALELIEVQSGSYLGEDDIVRIEDAYGRAAG